MECLVEMMIKVVCSTNSQYRQRPAEEEGRLLYLMVFLEETTSEMMIRLHNLRSQQARSLIASSTTKKTMTTNKRNKRL